MDDLIDRQAAIDYVDDVPYIKDHPNIALLWKAWVEQLPSAQPERKNGKWMVVDADIAESSDICECDQCGGRIWKYKNAKDTWHFCPRCGADMRGEQDE